jgi:hypothetical protein
MAGRESRRKARESEAGGNDDAARVAALKKKWFPVATMTKQWRGRRVLSDRQTVGALTRPRAADAPLRWVCENGPLARAVP